MARLPWWACLTAAVVAWIVLHLLASQPLPAPVNASQIGGALIGTFVRVGATIGQYIVPLLCAVAAVNSFRGRRERRELFLHATEGGPTAATIDAMSWQNFELLIAEGFRLQGYTVAEKGGASADGGVDMELVKDGDKWLVQAKHWRAKKVPVEVVREIAGVMPFRRAVGAFVVTSGTFTAPAEEFAKGRGIKLINGSKLDGMLAQARATLDGKRAGPPKANGFRQPKSWPSTEQPPDEPAPTCPKCSRPMVLRVAGRGRNAGGKFWGCTGFPKSCDGTLSA
ncbi:MAG: restriction endonuclease [Pseudomonadota bacterium]|nr:restriction endonuclease [Pseudomonadota bacterium]